MSDPFAAGSVSLRLYPHDLPAAELLEEMLEQARCAEAVGFDGIMVSEHHGGFPGYLPNPLQMAGWMLEVTSTVWVAACPLLPLLRPTAIVAEEVAWLAARHTGRVGVGFAAGALPLDFELAGVPFDEGRIGPRFAAALALLADALGRGIAPGPLAGDRAIARCASAPVPVISAAASPAAARRAASLGCGIILDSMAGSDRTRRLVDAYRGAGGAGPRIVVRRVWVGEPPGARVADQMALYRSYAASSAVSRWGADELVTSADPGDIAERLSGFCRTTGCDVLNVRVHMVGLEPEQAREQIGALADVVAAVDLG